MKVITTAAACWVVTGAALTMPGSTAMATTTESTAAAIPANCGPVFALRASVSGHYVAPEIGWFGDRNGLLRARSVAVGPWEKFRFCKIPSNEGGGHALRAEISGLYVSAEIGWQGYGYASLRARSAWVGPWERFSVSCNYGMDDECYLSSRFKFWSKASGKWVTPEIGYTGDNFGVLRARTQAWGPWEEFSAVRQ
jgi:hypothetical protein